MDQRSHKTAEDARLAQDDAREANWKRWGPYLSERQWGTVREDYSGDGAAWDYFPHEHARSRAYRWGEDGLLGISDRQCRLCFALALWNGRDPYLKERLFGLTGPQGNHGEDVKECYYYLDSTPTHSYMRALYKYPQREFPYARLLEENRRRGKDQGEFELGDTGVFEGGRYFDVQIEYAKETCDDILIRVTVANRASEAAEITVLPSVWFRNTWSWGRGGEEHGPKPTIERIGNTLLRCHHDTLGAYEIAFGAGPDGIEPELVFTDNESNTRRLWDAPGGPAHCKDAFHDYVVHGRADALARDARGTKAAAIYRLRLEPGEELSWRMRLCSAEQSSALSLGARFDRSLDRRRAEATEFYEARFPRELGLEERNVVRQAYAGLLWSKQFYHYIVPDWLEGDPAHPAPPPERKRGRNREWLHLYNRDVISMPDKWEYPWYAAWDLAFHMLPFAKVDTSFAKHQLGLFLREWYMHPNGQIPAYEWALGDVNPPVHAWAVWRVYKKTGAPGQRDRRFLASCFQKLLLNFTWWVNRKDSSGKHIFAGGFLGLDNIGVFDRSAPLPNGGHLDQADGTAWMAFYCGTMLSIAIELAQEDPSYEDMASKFFEHFIAIADAMNSLGGSGLWDPEDGFYYDQMTVDGRTFPLRVRSLVGVIPLLAVEILEQSTIDRLPGFAKRMTWFLENRKDLARHIGYMDHSATRTGRRLLAIPSRERLTRVLAYLLDEREFLSPFGIRSLSRVYQTQPYKLELAGNSYSVGYTPAESNTALFGGNSNWRGPIWFPINFLIVEALERYHHYYGGEIEVEFPTGSGQRMTLNRVAREIAKRLARIFLPDARGVRPCHGDDARYASDPHWRELVLFHEYFHAEDGRGVGASHQTGWTALAALLVEELAKNGDGGGLLETRFTRRPNLGGKRR
ncbi:MAG: glucosidase [Planctomycetes bacterium]|nr:glucosidase [Planctomycetota bacterium]